MEQPCYKCRQTVDEGVPFCPHCSAPQIRVVLAEPVTPVAAAFSSAASQDATVLPASQTLPVLALPMQWSQALKPCALAALVASLLMSMGLNPFVAMFSVGFLAVVFYRQGRRDAMIKASAGAGLGALGGLLWFAISSVLEALIVIFLHKAPELRHELIVRIQQAATQTSAGAGCIRAPEIPGWARDPDVNWSGFRLSRLHRAGRSRRRAGRSHTRPARSILMLYADILRRPHLPRMMHRLQFFR